jgi:hypothetical protein
VSFLTSEEKVSSIPRVVEHVWAELGKLKVEALTLIHANASEEGVKASNYFLSGGDVNFLLELLLRDLVRSLHPLDFNKPSLLRQQHL